MNSQGQFDFEAAGSGEGFTRWQEGRRLAIAELARRLNLPLGHQVELWLRGSVRLRGKLQLLEEGLLLEEDQVQHMRLRVDHVPFTLDEMESCIRLDCNNL